MKTIARWLGTLQRDLRFGARTLRQSPGFAAVTILSLALGIGANVAIFSVLDAALLRPLPVKEPDRLVLVQLKRPNGTSISFSHPLYRHIRAEQQALEGMLAVGELELRRAEAGARSLEKTTCRLVSRDYFRVLGVLPIRGRVFAEGESDPVVVISDRFWDRAFGRDPGVIGATLRLNGVPTSVAGVVPPAFFGESAGLAPDVFIPLDLVPQLVPGANWLESSRNYWLWIIGRLKPGLTAADAEVMLQRVNPRADLRIVLEPGAQGLNHLRRQYAGPLKVLMTAVGLLLLVACANVASLLLARASARQREIGIRQALGAEGSRIVRQLLTESLLLSVLGGALALAVASGGARFLLTMVSFSGQPVDLRAGLDWRVFGFTAALCAATTLLFGLAPALHLGRMNVSRSIASSWHAEGGSSRHPGSKALVAVQVALSVVLLAGASLLVESLSNLRHLDPGFVSANVVTAQLTFTPTPEGILRLNRISGPLAERLTAMPGVRAAAVSTYPVISRGYQAETVSLPERPARPGETIHLNHVTAGFFETYGIQLLAGRRLAVTDDASRPNAAVINERLARLYFGGADPVGRLVSLAPRFDPQKAWQVVGVVRNTKYHDLREEMPPQMYVPLSQGRQPGLFVGVRTAAGGAVPAVLMRQALLEVDSSTEIQSMTTLAAHVESTLGQERLMARLGLAFSLLALVLSWTGVYGTMSYAVARRTREIGVRSAVGATPGAIQAAVLLDALRPAAAGILAGAPLALGATRIIRGLLYGVEPGHLPTLLLTILTILGIAAAAAWLPARAASRVDPVAALRAE